MSRPKLIKTRTTSVPCFRHSRHHGFLPDFDEVNPAADS